MTPSIYIVKAQENPWKTRSNAILSGNVIQIKDWNIDE
jgi:hypothetical protein